MQQNTSSLAIGTVFLKYPDSNSHVLGMRALIQMGRALVRYAR
jgi:hypothetical protein